MKLDKDFADFISALNNNKVNYLIVGGYAMAFLGRPRFTGDLDIWIDCSEVNATKTLAAIKAFGFANLGITKKDLMQTNQVIQLGFPPVRIDVMTDLDGVHFKDAWQNRQTLTIDGLDLSHISKTDLIKNKTALGRTQDLADIKLLQKPLTKLGKTPRR